MLKDDASENSNQPDERGHRFLDEAGDATFYGKRKIPLLGSGQVSEYFLLGMLSVNEPLVQVRQKIRELQNAIASDSYFINVPSIQKKKVQNGYFLHAKDDVPEVRKMAFELIRSIDCHFEAVVARKDYGIYERKHNGNEAEFYADLLADLLKDSIYDYEKLVLNIAHRSRCTDHKNLEAGLIKSRTIATHKYPERNNHCEVVFNVQYPTTEPIINLADYFLWAIQREYEKGEQRYIEYLGRQIKTLHLPYGK